MKTATIDLSTSRVEIVETPAETLRQFLGGRGLGAKLLFDLVGPEVEPLSPGNYLIFTAGPLAGTPWPTSARLHVTFKSPLTGAYGYANSGGFFAAEMRHAGYDALVITGRAPQPSVLRIEDGSIRVEAAAGAVGPDHRSRPRRSAGTGAQGQRRPGGLHRPGGREPGAHRGHHQRPQPGGGAGRSGRGHGQQESQGHPRPRRRPARHPARAPRRRPKPPRPS